MKAWKRFEAMLNREGDGCALFVFALLVGIGLLLGACGTVSTDPVYMRHAATGATAQCGPYSTVGMRHLAAVEHERGCINDYRAQGYVRVSAP